VIVVVAQYLVWQFH